MGALPPGLSQVAPRGLCPVSFLGARCCQPSCPARGQTRWAQEGGPRPRHLCHHPPPRAKGRPRPGEKGGCGGRSWQRALRARAAPGWFPPQPLCRAHPAGASPHLPVTGAAAADLPTPGAPVGTRCLLHARGCRLVWALPEGTHPHSHPGRSNGTRGRGACGSERGALLRGGQMGPSLHPRGEPSIREGLGKGMRPAWVWGREGWQGGYGQGLGVTAGGWGARPATTSPGERGCGSELEQKPLGRGLCETGSLLEDRAPGLAPTRPHAGAFLWVPLRGRLGVQGCGRPQGDSHGRCPAAHDSQAPGEAEGGHLLFTGGSAPPGPGAAGTALPSPPGGCAPSSPLAPRGTGRAGAPGVTPRRRDGWLAVSRPRARCAGEGKWPPGSCRRCGAAAGDRGRSPLSAGALRACCGALGCGEAARPAWRPASARVHPHCGERAAGTAQARPRPARGCVCPSAGAWGRCRPRYPVAEGSVAGRGAASSPPLRVASARLPSAPRRRL